MRIAEISTPDYRQLHRETESHTHHPLLSEIELLIQQSESISKDQPLPQTLPHSLRQSLTRLSQLAPLPGNSFKLTIWKLSFRLWNACVDLSNAAALQSSSSSAESIANLRHAAADMLFLARDVTGVPSPTIKSSLIYYRTGLVWHDLKKLDLASDCFERATEILSKIDVAKITDAGERILFLDLNLARSRTAWEISDRNLAVTLLNRAKNMLFGSPDHYKALSNQFLAFGKSALSREDDDCSLNDALRLMNE